MDFENIKFLMRNDEFNGGEIGKDETPQKYYI